VAQQVDTLTLMNPQPTAALAGSARPLAGSRRNTINVQENS